MPSSAIYTGKVRHRRFTPVANAFQYRMAMVYLDLEETEELLNRTPLFAWNKSAPVALHRKDHPGDPSISLAEYIRRLVEEETGQRPDGPIRMLTNLRYFGYAFNPVTFYYIFNKSGDEVETIVSEITNTPWLETHSYVLPIKTANAQKGRFRFQFKKDFHVSPFMGMNVKYDWRFGTPGKSLFVHMDNLESTGKSFDATLTLHRREFTTPNALGMVARFPVMSVTVVALIYWQALKLWLKKVPFHPHPAR